MSALPHPDSPLERRGPDATRVPARIVVVGHGMVAQRLLENLVANGTAAHARIDVVAEEARPAYDRVGLSGYLDHGDAERLTVTPRDFFDHPNLHLHLADPAERVERGRRIVRTASGAEHRYDRLVLAAGSAAFVPPVPGCDAAGVFVYRTLDDLDAIAARAALPVAQRRTGVVVGGGLLGLEAANALRTLGLDTHVVELADRLMPVQLDAGGAAMLRRHVEGLGIAVHLGARTQRVVVGADGSVQGLLLAAADGTELTLDAHVVVISAGIRPRDELARGCGLPVGERGGVVVDPWCRTADPSVLAAGEVACAAGRTWGLVAPGYRMADVVADQLRADVVADRLRADAAGIATADGPRFDGAEMSTKLKLLGVDVGSVGDCHGATEGAVELVWNDPSQLVYKKVVVSDDGRRVLGAVLVGDAAAYDVLRPMVAGGTAVTDPVESILFAGSGGSADGGGGPAGLPDAAVICSCNTVTKGAILAACDEPGLCELAALKQCTRAGTGCGSCTPVVQALLNASLERRGVTVDRSLCEHFRMTRRDLFDVIRVRGLQTFSDVVAAVGTGRGCDICKPAIASILATQAPRHVLDGENAALQDTNDHVMANLQRNGTYSVVPRMPGGEVTPDGLVAIGEIARDFGLYTKITGGQRIDMFGARIEQLPEIWRRLVAHGFESGHAYGKALRTVKSCVGSDWCRYGVQDSTGLAVALELRYRGLRAPHKLKAAVSGCARECAEAQGKDFGVIATEQGWNLYVCGNGGMRPRHADLLATDLDTGTLIRLVDRFLMYYIRTADRLQRTSVWLESLGTADESGLAHLQRVVVDDGLGIAEELEADMARHVAGYADEWAQTLADPAKLARFRSFVNAADLPDPDIAFVPQRGQQRPATPDEVAAAPGRLAVLVPVADLQRIGSTSEKTPEEATA
jgi:nitrite reductase (NADH) large subunit